MKNIIVILMLTISVAASASWRVKQHPHNQGYYVINGSDANPNTVWIKAKNKRAAKKLANKLNKAEKKDENGFWNDGSEHCANPLNEC